MSQAMQPKDSSLYISHHAPDKGKTIVEHVGYQRRPMTLCRHKVSIHIQQTLERGAGVLPYHFERPDSSDPDLQFALDALDIGELDALPPASPRRFPPEEQQLLRHADGVCGSLALDVGP